MTNPHEIDLIISPLGEIESIYDDAVDLRAIGPRLITRVSHVEPDEDGSWRVDLSPVGGPELGPFTLRGDALEAEVNWLRRNRLGVHRR